jgi:hypothetical protein
MMVGCSRGDFPGQAISVPNKYWVRWATAHPLRWQWLVFCTRVKDAWYWICDKKMGDGKKRRTQRMN